MGVLRDETNIFSYESSGDDLERLENDVREEILTQNLKRQRKSVGKNRFQLNKLQLDNVHQGSSKKTGVKKSRRGENMKYLLNLTEKDDDVELSMEVGEPSMSVFAELFMEHEKMKAWKDFMNSSEEEQGRILQQGSTNTTNNKDRHKVKEDGELDSWEEIPDNRAGSNKARQCPGIEKFSDIVPPVWAKLLLHLLSPVSDFTTVHPAYTAEECYQRLDRNIRMFLKRRNIPVGILKNLEQDLISFFSDWPGSVYISKLTSSFERMLLHAICQYLNLSSTSFDDGNCRQTHVENKFPSFSPPSVLLSAYLQKSAMS